MTETGTPTRMTSHVVLVAKRIWSEGKTYRVYRKNGSMIGRLLRSRSYCVRRVTLRMVMVRRRAKRWELQINPLQV